MNAHVVLNLKPTKMPRLATILIALMGSASLCIAPLAFAQSVDDSSGPPRSHTDWVQVPETNSDATSGGNGQVIEIPQSADAAQAAAPNSDDNSPARASNEGPGDEYAIDELGGLNDYAYGDYDPYWAWWYPAPIYYYSRGNGGHDCDGGNCGSRVGGHGSHHNPPLRTRPSTRPPVTASHPLSALGIPHASSAPAVASAPSGGFGNSGDFDRGGGFGRRGFGNGSGFGGGRGFGGSGFGGAQGGFGHR